MKLAMAIGIAIVGYLMDVALWFRPTLKLRQDMYVYGVLYSSITLDEVEYR